jgi:DNA-binding FrmR family transcriptional regulator
MELKTTECGSCDAEQEIFDKGSASSFEHMDHTATKKRISRAKGQLEAVARMIDEKHYCPEIIYQMRAVTNALKAAEQEILQRHLRGCVKTAFQSKDPFEMDEKIKEIMKLMSSN